LKLILLLSLLITVLPVWKAFSHAIATSNVSETKTIIDGPYVSINNDKLDFNWVCHSQAKSLSIKASSLPYSFSECGLQANITSLAVTEQKITYNGDFTVAALSDLHGQYDLMLKLLSNNKIIDENNKWGFGSNHLVINGDVLGRGDKVTEILWFLYSLEQQAIAAGGNLHLLLGNHEVMVLNNRLKYMHKKYLESALILKQPFSELFSQNSVLGAWIRSKNVLVKINDSLFVHGGLHPDLVNENMSLATINNIFKENLVESELEAPRLGMAKFLHTTNGPIWYRGYFNEIKATPEEIDRLLTYFKVARIVVGHTSQDQVVSLYQDSVIGIDTSMKRGLNGEVLFLKGDTKWRGSLNGTRYAL
jgi:hypothetical protein